MSVASKLIGFVLLVVGAVGFVTLRAEPSRARSLASRAAVIPSEERASSREPDAVLTRPSKAAPTTPVRAVAPLDEAAVMTKLREIGPADPERAIRLARYGNARFPSGIDAAERGFIVVKSLSALGRFQEAHDEALVMVARFRGTPWAEDVERHLLVYPLGQPSREEMQAMEH